MPPPKTATCFLGVLLPLLPRPPLPLFLGPVSVDAWRFVTTVVVVVVAAVVVSYWNRGREAEVVVGLEVMLLRCRRAMLLYRATGPALVAGCRASRHARLRRATSAASEEGGRRRSSMLAANQWQWQWINPTARAEPSRAEPIGSLCSSSFLLPGVGGLLQEICVYLVGFNL